MTALVQRIPAAVLALLNAAEKPADLPETEFERRNEIRVEADLPASSLYVMRDELVDDVGGTMGGRAGLIESRRLTLAHGFSCAGGWNDAQPMLTWIRAALGRQTLHDSEDEKPLARSMRLAIQTVDYGTAGSREIVKIVTAIAVVYQVRATDAAIRA